MEQGYLEMGGLLVFMELYEYQNKFGFAPLFNAYYDWPGSVIPSRLKMSPDHYWAFSAEMRLRGEPLKFQGLDVVMCETVETFEFE